MKTMIQVCVCVCVCVHACLCVRGRDAVSYFKYSAQG